VSDAHQIVPYLNVLLSVFDVSVAAVVLANNVSMEHFYRTPHTLRTTSLLHFSLWIRNLEAFERLARLDGSDLIKKVFVLLFDVEIAQKVVELLLGVVDSDHMFTVAKFVDRLNVGKSTAVREVVVQINLLEHDLARAPFKGVAMVDGSGYLFKHLTDLFN